MLFPQNLFQLQRGDLLLRSPFSLKPSAWQLILDPAGSFSCVGTMNDGNAGGPKGPANDNNSPLSTPASTGYSSESSAGTNVVRVPFGVRRPRRSRPQRPDHWATLVLPFQVMGGSDPTPPQAA